MAERATKDCFARTVPKMNVYELCTYHFRSSEILDAALPVWFEFIQFLFEMGIETHGVYRSPLRPDAVVALVSYDDSLVSQGAQHQALEDALFLFGRLDPKQMIRTDFLPMEPVPDIV